MRTIKIWYKLISSDQNHFIRILSDEFWSRINGDPEMCQIRQKRKTEALEWLKTLDD